MVVFLSETMAKPAKARGCHPLVDRTGVDITRCEA
jgi:hypothetical protein